MSREMFMTVRAGMAHKHTHRCHVSWSKSHCGQSGRRSFRVVCSICDTGRQMYDSDQSNKALKVLVLTHIKFLFNACSLSELPVALIESLRKLSWDLPTSHPSVQSCPGGPIRPWNLPLEELAQWQGAPGLHLLQTFLLYFNKPVSVSLDGTYYCTRSPDLLQFNDYYWAFCRM